MIRQASQSPMRQYVQICIHGSVGRRLAAALERRGFSIVDATDLHADGSSPVIELHDFPSVASPALSLGQAGPDRLRVALFQAGLCRDPTLLEIEALAQGFDEAVAAGTSLARLEARLMALTRRLSRASEVAASAADMDVLWNGRPVHMSTIPRRTLLVLWRQRGFPVTRGRFLELCWPDGAEMFDRSVDSAIKRLRIALRAAGAPDSLVTSRKRLGYELDPGAQDLGLSLRERPLRHFSAWRA